MTTSQRSTVVGVFEDRHQADKAVSELQKAGFRSDEIGVAMRHVEAMGTTSATAESEDSYAGTGAIAGALTGLGLGALAGLGVLAGVVPIIGPAIAAGTLGVILTNAAAGAGIAGLVGALIGAGIPEEEAKFYHSEFEAGRAIVSVKADGRYDEAMAIMRRHGAYDMTSRGTAESARMAGAASTATVDPVTGLKNDTIEVKEERLHAEKTPVEAGEVRVHKEVHTETKSMDVPVQREEVVIERTPVHGRAAKEGVDAGGLREGEEIRIPVREDQVTVTKEALVVEEVNVGKRVVQDTEQVTGQVSKEEVKVEQTGDVDIHSRGPDKGKNRT